MVMSIMRSVILKNSIQVHLQFCVNLPNLNFLFFVEREKVKRSSSDILKIESVLNSSISSEDRSSSPILTTISPVHFQKFTTCSGAAGTPGTPVDIKSVPQIRQLSCKKLIYSYTFGSNCSDCSASSCSSNEASPSLFSKSANNRSSPINNCRQSFKKTSSEFMSSNIEFASGPIPVQSPFKRKTLYK